ncbi:hypothetical protein BJX70DRAFT_204395 [Aspergillus crustosus]
MNLAFFPLAYLSKKVAAELVPHSPPTPIFSIGGNPHQVTKPNPSSSPLLSSPLLSQYSIPTSPPHPTLLSALALSQSLCRLPTRYSSIKIIFFST